MSLALHGRCTSRYSAGIQTRSLIRLPQRMLRLFVSVLWGHAYLNEHLSIMRAVDNPYCSHCQGAYKTAAHFVGECGRYASLRQEIRGKPYLHPNDFQHVTVDLVSFIRK